MCWLLVALSFFVDVGRGLSRGVRRAWPSGLRTALGGGGRCLGGRRWGLCVGYWSRWRSSSTCVEVCREGCVEHGHLACEQHWGEALGACGDGCAGYLSYCVYRLWWPRFRSLVTWRCWALPCGCRGW